MQKQKTRDVKVDGVYLEDGRIVLERLIIARGFVQRGVGLLGRKGLEPSTGLLIDTFSIHTFFMRFSLDLLYIDADGVVVKVVRNIAPWRMSWARGAQQVIECASGELPGYVKSGNKVLF